MRIMRSREFIIPFLLAMLLLTMSGPAAGQVRVAIAVGPPPIPVYEQPICPGDGYIWTPGYWDYDYDDGDYYWVPGTWVPAPETGYLWTPGYWAWGGDGFVFTSGYWGPVIGFYGGINYGFGYFGHGYEGGRWEGGHFYYNTTVNRVNVEVVHNVYNTRVSETTTSRVSYNGGNGGIAARPRPEEEAAARQRHIEPVSAQLQHEQAARSNKQQRASINHGAPGVAATPKPGAFRENGAVRTRETGGAYDPAPRPENNVSKNNTIKNSTSNPAVHPNDIPRMDRPPAPNSSNPKEDLKYQQQQEKLQAKQQKELQKLQQRQEQEHQQIAKQQSNDAKHQQMEQRHQQQTQQLQQKHAQQTQQMQQRQQPPPPHPHPNENKPPN
jgi:hypothetical protein